MIKINLLPIKAAKKREYVKQQLVLFAVVLIGAAVGLFMWYARTEMKIKGQQEQIASARAQIAQYEKAIGEVSKYKGLEEILNRKLSVIDGLIKGKTGPVKVFDFLSQAIPREVWLMSWAEGGGSVTLLGEALTNKDVAQFMAILGNMGSTPKEAAAQPAGGKGPAEAKAAAQGSGAQTFFSDIRLVKTSMKTYPEFSRPFVEFEIKMKVNYSI